MPIHSIVPDATALLALEPEELAGVLMEVTTRVTVTAISAWRNPSLVDSRLYYLSL